MLTEVVKTRPTYVFKYERKKERKKKEIGNRTRVESGTGEIKI
jgi:hypothetical protein